MQHGLQQLFKERDPLFKVRGGAEFVVSALVRVPDRNLVEKNIFIPQAPDAFSITSTPKSRRVAITIDSMFSLPSCPSDRASSRSALP